MRTFGQRMVASLLSLGMLLSAPVTAYAETGGAGGSAQGNNNGGVVTSSGGDFGVNPPEGRIGIRLSLVDSADPTNVISRNPNNVNERRVVDILYVDWNTYDKFVGTDMVKGHLTTLTEDNMYDAVKTQSINDGHETNIIEQLSYPEFLDALEVRDINDTTPVNYDMKNVEGDPLYMPPWASYHDNAYYSEGEAFVKWCKSDEAGNTVLGGGIVDYWTTNRNGEKIKVEYTGNKYTASTGDQKVVYEFSFTDSYSSFKKHLEGTEINSLLGGPVEAEYTYSVLADAISLLAESGNCSESEAGELMDLLNKRMEELKSKQTSASLGVLDRVKSLVTPLKVEAAPDDIIPEVPNGGTTNNGTAENNQNAEEINENAWILRVLDMLDGNGQRYFMTPSMIENGTNSLSDATEDWVLLVEPLVYLTIFEAGDDKHYALPKQYGTISNIAEAMTLKLGGKYANNAKYGFFNWKALNGPLWGALSVSSADPTDGFTFASGDKLNAVGDYGSYVSFAELAKRNEPQITGNQNADGKTTWYKSGYGVNVYYRAQFSSWTHTWDYENPKYSNGFPGPSPDCKDAPEEPTYKELSKKFKVAKWYYIESPDGSQHVYDVQVRNDTPHQVIVENEGEVGSKYYWEVERWGTGKEDKVPASGDKSSTYEAYWNANKGTYTNTIPDIVTVGPDDPDKVLYVKLVLRVIDKDTLTIKKYYPDKPVETEVIQKVPNYDANEEGYVYVEDKQTPEPPKEAEKWEDTPSGTPGSTPNIPVDEDTKTIYIKYDKPDQVSPDVITLHQNELAHVFSLSDMAELVTQTHSFSDKSGSGHDEHDCGGCEEDDDGDSYCPGHPCSWERYIDDDNYSYVISNKENYSETNFIGANGAFASVETGIVDDSGSLGIGGGTTSGLTPNLNFTL